MLKKEFEELEDSVYLCLYEQEIYDISKCKYFDQCPVCKEYIQAVEYQYPLVTKYIERCGTYENEK